MKYQDIAAAWLKKDKNGKTFISVKVSKELKPGESFNLFKNDKGGVETRPDFRAYAKVEDEQDRSDNPEDSAVADDVVDKIPF